MRRRFLATSVKLALFVAVAVFATVITVNTLDPPLDGPANSYRAVFTDATGVVRGSDVRVAGVRVGKVTGVTLNGPRALVRFDIETAQAIPADARAVIRYADLLGSRYVAIQPGASGTGGARLASGGEIPLERTQPALDLTALLNGFKPIFDVLDPKEINSFAGTIIAVFQGEGPTVLNLLQRTVSVTQNIAARNGTIGAVLTNLNSVVDFALKHRTDFEQLLAGLATLTKGLAEDRNQILSALDATAGLARSVSGVVDALAPDMDRTLRSANAATRALVNNTAPFNAALQNLQPLLNTALRILDYGSWGNIYVCNLHIELLTGNVDLSAGPHSEVCRP